jgi:hypothetical protein
VSVYLTGEFREREEVREAIVALRSAGLDPADLDLFSEEPIDLPRSVLDRHSRMSVASVCGAILCGSAATLFILWAQHNYRLITGGMPTFSFWATGVITYEMTMLGAILTTFAWFLYESGLLRKRDHSAPVPVVAPGSICMRVRCQADQALRITDTMRRAGAIGVDRSNP